MRSFAVHETGFFRSCAECAYYLGPDRPELAYATKALRRRMRAPTRHGLRVIFRFAWQPLVTYMFAWQRGSDLRASIDSDFAGCLSTRCSTSGGCMWYGAHLVKHWNVTRKTQKSEFRAGGNRRRESNKRCGSRRLQRTWAYRPRSRCTLILWRLPASGIGAASIASKVQR